MGNCLATRVNNHQSPPPTNYLPAESLGKHHNKYDKQQVKGGEISSAASRNGQSRQDSVVSTRSNSGSSSSRGKGKGEGGSSRGKDEGGGSSKFNTPNLKMFTLSELRSATRNFRPDTMLGEGGFGRVFKGWIDEKTLVPSRVGVGMAVAIKKSNPDSDQGLREWQAEVKFLGKFSHPNLVKLFGYCWEEDQFLLVYEYMQKGSLENHLFRNGAEPLSWEIRLKIGIGAAQGLAFLHTSEKSVIYRDFKTSNILLDSEYNAKLSDFGLAKLGPINGNSHVTTRILGTYGYAAPEYVATGHLYVKSDVYGFGVVLLELLTGLRALDQNRPSSEHNLIEWAKPSLSVKKKLRKIMDPRLDHQYSIKAAMLIAQLVLRCLESDPKNRPSMEEVRDELISANHIKEMAPPRKVKGKSHGDKDSPKKSPRPRNNGVRVHPPSASSTWSRV